MDFPHQISLQSKTKPKDCPQIKKLTTPCHNDLLSEKRRSVQTVVGSYVRTVKVAQSPGGAGGTLIFSLIRRLGLFFLVQSSEFQFFGRGLQRNEYFLGYEDFVDIFFGSSQNWASLRVISMHFRVFFLRSRFRIGIFFGVAKI